MSAGDVAAIVYKEDFPIPKAGGCPSHLFERRYPKVGALVRIFQAARCEFASKDSAAVSEASAVRTTGATRVPSSSIARSIFACGNAATLIWKVRREIPPNDSFTCRIFSATV